MLDVIQRCVLEEILKRERCLVRAAGRVEEEVEVGVVQTWLGFCGGVIKSKFDPICGLVRVFVGFGVKAKLEPMDHWTSPSNLDAFNQLSIYTPRHVLCVGKCLSAMQPWYFHFTSYPRTSASSSREASIAFTALGYPASRAPHFPVPRLLSASLSDSIAL